MIYRKELTVRLATDTDSYQIITLLKENSLMDERQ